MYFLSVFIAQCGVHQIPYTFMGYVEAYFHNHTSNHDTCQRVHDMKALRGSDDSNQCSYR